MSFKTEVKCSNCNTEESAFWFTDKDDSEYCKVCYDFIVVEKAAVANEGGHPSINIPTHKNPKLPTRKSTRMTRIRKKKLDLYLSKSSSGKGKRKRLPMKIDFKAPDPVFQLVESGIVDYKGVEYRAGDIVSLMDLSGDLFYAQVRGFLRDQYTNLNAVITWLVPTEASPARGFDHNTFILGFEEDIPRPMSTLEFVCHAPSEYYMLDVVPKAVPTDWRSFIAQMMMPASQSGSGSSSVETKD